VFDCTRVLKVAFRVFGLLVTVDGIVIGNEWAGCGLPLQMPVIGLRES
jgi:hypothetical protein